jgi:hypothetical protein
MEFAYCKIQVEIMQLDTGNKEEMILNLRKGKVVFYE